MTDKNHLMFTDDAGDVWVQAKEYDRLRAEAKQLKIDVRDLTGIIKGYKKEIETMRHEIANRDLTREIQREIWAKEVELSSLRSQLASAWGTLR
jgi:predicted RNase H-like nuclease (RuvC/YqgF family)